ncbi:hypothetical protein PG984_008409 [Apiospora sp. TS-2023a]
MGLADTIRETFGGGAAATHPEESSSSPEVSRGLVDSHTPGAFPADTPIAEEQRELGGSSQYGNTTGTTSNSNILAGKEGVRGHDHKDSGVGLSDVTSSHPKTVGHDDVLHSTTGGSKLSDVTHSHPQSVEKSGLHGSTAASNTPVASGLSDVTRSRPETVGQSGLHSTTAGTTAPSSGLSDVTHSSPQTVEKGALQSHPQSTLQSHPQSSHNNDALTGSHFRRSSVSMPTDSTGTGPSETLASHGKKDTTTLGSLLGGNYMGGSKTDPASFEREHANEPASRGLLRSEDHNNAHQGTHGSTLGSGVSSGTTLGATGTDSTAHHNTVSNGRDKSSTDHTESYWGSLPSAQGIYNTVTGSGSGEDHTAVHRRVPAAGDSEVAMQSAGHGPEAHAPRGAGVYNTVVGHGSAADDTIPGQTRSADHQRSPSGGLYNTITSAAAGLYNTVSGRSDSGTEHQYEHDKPLTTTTSTSSGLGNTGLTGSNSRVEHESPFSNTTSTTSPRSGNTTSTGTTGNNQGIAAGAYGAAASAAQGISNAVTGNNNNNNTHNTSRDVPQYGTNNPFNDTTSTSTGTGSTGLTGINNRSAHDSPLTSTTSPRSGNLDKVDTTGSAGLATGAYNAAASAAQGISNTVTGNNNNNNTSATGTQYDHNRPTTSTGPIGTRNTNTTSSTEPGMATGAYNAVANTAQSVADTVTGNNRNTSSQYNQGGPYDSTTSRSAYPSTTGNTHTNTTGSQPGVAAGAYNAVAGAAQTVADTVTGNNNNNNRSTGSQYEQGGPYDSTTSRSAYPTTTGNTHTNTSSTQPGVAAGAYNAVAGAAQTVANTVTGNNNNNHGSTTGHQSGLNNDNTTGTHRAFPLDNSSPTFNTANRSAVAGDERFPTSGTNTGSHDHTSHTGRNIAGAGAGAAAGAGVYDFLHRKEGDAPDPLNEFVSNEGPYNTRTHEHEGWAPSQSAGLFSDTELKRLSLRQKEGDSLEPSSHRSHAEDLSTSGPGQSHGFHGMKSHPSSGSNVAYDTPESLAAAGASGDRTRGDIYNGQGQTHGLGSGHPSAHKSEIPIPSRVHENPHPTSLAGQRAEPPRSSDHSDHSSNIGKGLAGAGLGAGAGYGASRLARDHHDDQKHAATSSIPSPTTTSSHHEPVESSTLNRSVEPISSSSHHHHHKDNSSPTSGSMLPLPSKHNDRHAQDTTPSSGLSGHDSDKHQHKARDVAAFGAGAGAGAAGYDMFSHDKSSPSGVRHPGQTTANTTASNTASNTASSSHPTMSSIAADRRTAHSPTTSSSLNTAATPETASLDEHQRSRAAAGMTGINPAAGVAGLGVGAGGAGAAIASGMNQDGHSQQQQQDMLSRSGGDGHPPLQSSHAENLKERGTTVPSANAGKKDPYNHLSSGTPSGVVLE